MTPYTTLALTPYTITGPAMVNIFAPTPKMKPSACVKLGPIYSCSIRTKFFENHVDLVRIVVFPRKHLAERENAREIQAHLESEKYGNINPEEHKEDLPVQWRRCQEGKEVQEEG